MVSEMDGAEERELQKTYDRGRYAAILLLFWFVLFLEIKTWWMGMIVSTLISTCFMGMYAFFLHCVQETLEKRVKNVSLKKWIPFAATIAYEVIPLWTMRNSTPVWLLVMIAIAMTVYYWLALQSSLKKRFNGAFNYS